MGNTCFSQVVPVITCDSVPKLCERIQKELNTANADDVLQTARVICYAEGFLNPSIGLDLSDSLKPTINISPGVQYRWVDLSMGEQEKLILITQKQDFKNLEGKPVSPQTLSEYMNTLLVYFENSGFPFASVRLDSVSVKEGAISATLVSTPGPEITIDSVSIIGTAKISDKYISNYIRIKKGSFYNEQRLREIPKRMDELAFVSQPKPSEILFTDKSTTLVIPLNKEKANDFNGVLGFQPDANTGELVITGDVHLKLLSALGKGESFELRWRRLQTQTQDIGLAMNLPFLLNTPLGFDGSFRIYRRDTTFSTITAKAGIQYALTGGDFFEVNVTSENSNIISTQPYEGSSTLPDVADVSYLHYGITFKSSKLDYKLNPRRGFSFLASGGVGEKTIRENPALEEVNYDSLDLNSTQYKVSLNGSIFIPVIKRGAIHYRAQAGLIQNETLFRNELFRLGGLRSIRGFDEESIFASGYIIQSLETRFILEKDAYTYLFFDYALYENTASNTNERDDPYGFGAGVSFRTGTGIFSVNYGLGSRFNQSIDIRSGKIHFGFVSFF